MCHVTRGESPHQSGPARSPQSPAPVQPPHKSADDGLLLMLKGMKMPPHEERCFYCNRIGTRWAGEDQLWLCEDHAFWAENDPREQAADDYCTDGGE